jgi:hypothetical protein
MVRRAIPGQIDLCMREAARNRCGYWLSPQHLVMARLEVEHIIPYMVPPSVLSRSCYNTNNTTSSCNGGRG